MADYDSPWKNALQLYFPPFLELFFPVAHGDIDWSRGYESLDKELIGLAPESEHGTLFVDKLMRVWRRGGADAIVLVHVEVQSPRDADFAGRMYGYNTRLKDRYNQRVVSLAVLADDDPGWRPDRYEDGLWDWSVVMRFPTVKLLDWAPREAELLASPNPFTRVVLAHLMTLQTRRDPEGRRGRKFGLVRNLYEQGFGREDARKLFRLIDWLMELPAPQRAQFWQELAVLEQERAMPFVSTAEIMMRRDGQLEMIEVLLRKRFGESGAGLMVQVKEVLNYDLLRPLFSQLVDATTVDEARQAITEAQQAPLPPWGENGGQ